MTALGFIAGWIACLAFIFIAEFGADIIHGMRVRRAVRRRIDELCDEQCPWPIARERDRASSHDVSDPTR
jgi:hypothetical protein